MDGKSLTNLSPGVLNLTVGLSMICVMGIFPASGSAADLLHEAVLPLSMATRAASAAVRKCTKDGYQISAAVVDRAGVVRALLREDGAAVLIQWQAVVKRPTRLQVSRDQLQTWQS